MKKIYQFVFAPLLILLLAASLMALPPQQRKRVSFAKGSSGTVLKGGIARGEYFDYLLGASRGQTIKVHITSEEDNAVFDLSFAENKKKLASEVRDFESTLPSSGDYVIRVGSERGGASYSLSIEID